MKTDLKLGILLLAIAACFGMSTTDNNITADNILQLANQDRARYGLPALSLDPTLSLAAHAKAEDMVTKGYFNHVSPDGVAPWHFFKAMGYDFRYAGENLALNYDDPEDLEDSWMSSPRHRENILSPHFSEIGLAVVTDRDRTMVVQFFGSRDSLISYEPQLLK